MFQGWKWGQVLEYLHGLMRPEISHDLMKMTQELAEILGIDLAEGKEAQPGNMARSAREPLRAR